MKEFRIHFDEEQIEELRRRISNTRPAKPLNDGSWCLGTDGAYLSSLLEYWRNGYDWTKKETELNKYPQFTLMFTEMSHGGHFTALEQPKEYAENISRFMNLIK